MGHSHHHHHGHSERTDRGQYVQNGPEHRMLRRVASAAIAVSLTLLIAKVWAWSRTDATSLLSSLADSLFDMMVSWINFFAIRYAIKPADDDHRFGHQSIEDIAGMAQFAFICGSMIFVIAQALMSLVHGHRVEAPADGIAVMTLSLVLTTALVIYQRNVFKRTKSLIVQADSLHYYSDIMMNISIIGSLLAVKFLGIMWLDSVLAIGIALYVMKEGLEVGKRAFNNLMNKEMPDTEKAKIHTLMTGYAEVKGMHNLKTRYSGAKPFIQMHVDLSESLTFLQAHEMVDRIEHDLDLLFPGADVIVHPDPVADESRLNQQPKER